MRLTFSVYIISVDMIHNNLLLSWELFSLNVCFLVTLQIPPTLWTIFVHVPVRSVLLLIVRNHCKQNSNENQLELATLKLI
jgi:hypothetical protein